MLVRVFATGTKSFQKHLMGGRIHLAHSFIGFGPQSLGPLCLGKLLVCGGGALLSHGGQEGGRGKYF